MLSFYIDHNFHAGVVEGLRRRNIDCLTAYEDGYAKAKDPAILQRATDFKRVFLSHDTDLIEIAREWGNIGKQFHGVIYTAQKRLDIGRVIFDIQLIAELFSDDEIINNLFWIPL